MAAVVGVLGYAVAGDPAAAGGPQVQRRRLRSRRPAARAEKDARARRGPTELPFAAWARWRQKVTRRAMREPMGLTGAVSAYRGSAA